MALNRMFIVDNSGLSKDTDYVEILNTNRPRGATE